MDKDIYNIYNLSCDLKLGISKIANWESKNMQECFDISFSWLPYRCTISKEEATQLALDILKEHETKSFIRFGERANKAFEDTGLTAKQIAEIAYCNSINQKSDWKY